MKNEYTFIQTEKAKSSHFDRTRGDKKQIFPTLVPLQKPLCLHKNQFYWMQIIFLSGTKCLWLPQYVYTFLVWHKKFGTVQNILWPVKGQGIKLKNFHSFWKVARARKQMLRWSQHRLLTYVKCKQSVYLYSDWKIMMKTGEESKL